MPSSPATLAAALDAWRGSREPAIADVIDRLDASIRFNPPAERSVASFQDEYLRIARDDASDEAGSFLAHCVGKRLGPPRSNHGPGVAYLPSWEEHPSGRHFHLRVRLDALALRPDDPRLARFLVDLLSSCPWKETAAEHSYLRALALVRALDDPRQAPRLRAIVKQGLGTTSWARTWFAAAIPEVAEHLERRGAQLASPMRGHAGEGRLRGLLAAVTHDLDDDASRAVYADALLEIGDSRGELISLQLQPDTPGARERVKKLLGLHRDAWLGAALARVLRTPEFERGFLAAAALAENAAATAETWAAAAADPRLATLSTLELGRGNARHLVAFATSVHTRNLRALEVPSGAVLVALARARESEPVFNSTTPGSPLARVTAVLITFSFNAAALGLIEAVFPELRRLFVALSGPAVLEVARDVGRSSLASRLQEFGIRDEHAHIRMPPHPWGEIRESLPITIALTRCDPVPLRRLVADSRTDQAAPL